MRILQAAFIGTLLFMMNVLVTGCDTDDDPIPSTHLRIGVRSHYTAPLSVNGTTITLDEGYFHINTVEVDQGGVTVRRAMPELELRHAGSSSNTHFDAPSATINLLDFLSFFAETTTLDANVYRSVSLHVSPATSGPSDGKTLWLRGTVANGSVSTPFLIEWTVFTEDYKGFTTDRLRLQAEKQVDLILNLRWEAIFRDLDILSGTASGGVIRIWENENTALHDQFLQQFYDGIDATVEIALN